MGITDFTFRLILLFIPGIISFIIIDNLTIHKETKIHHWLIYSLLLGFLSYMPWTVLIDIIQSIYDVNLPFQFVTNLINTNTTINFYEITIASITAIMWGLLFAKAINGSWLFRITTKFGISRKFTEIDAWANFLALYNPDFVRVRDLAQGYTYQGILVSSSDANDRDGIVLQDVSVYDSDNPENPLYHVEVIYIPQKMEELLVELI